jgi:hypothetical protein
MAWCFGLKVLQKRHETSSSLLVILFLFDFFNPLDIKADKRFKIRYVPNKPTKHMAIS